MKNGNQSSYKIYASGWKGGSRAKIKTYKMESVNKAGRKINDFIDVAEGIPNISKGFQEDGNTIGKNTGKEIVKTTTK